AHRQVNLHTSREPALRAGLDTSAATYPAAPRCGHVTSLVSGFSPAGAEQRGTNRLVAENRPGARQERLGGLFPRAAADQPVRLLIFGSVRWQSQKGRACRGDHDARIGVIAE